MKQANWQYMYVKFLRTFAILVLVVIASLYNTILFLDVVETALGFENRLSSMKIKIRV